jgi:hypothetical protein
MTLAEEAFRRIDSNPHLSRVAKARWQEAGTRRIEQALRGDRAIV